MSDNETSFSVGDKVCAPDFFKRGIIATITTTGDDNNPCAIVHLAEGMWAMPDSMLKTVSPPNMKQDARFVAYMSHVVVSLSNLEPGDW